jgi:hypothetical protein
MEMIPMQSGKVRRDDKFVWIKINGQIKEVCRNIMIIYDA